MSRPDVHVALCVLVRDGRLLVARKRGAAFFTLPGGKPEPGESAVAALRREIFEELGIVLIEHEIRPLGRFTAAAANEPGRRVVAELFELATAEAPVLQAELEELNWRPLDEDAPDLAPLLREQVLPRLRAQAG